MEVEISEKSNYSLKETALELRYILKNNETFSNLSVAIVSQKYQEFSMQVKNREESYYSFKARYKKNCHSF